MHFLLAVFVAASVSAQRIHHRVVSSPRDLLDTPWRLRASLRPVSDSAPEYDLISAPDFASDWSSYTAIDHPDALYQLALESDIHPSQAEWDIVSTRAVCAGLIFAYMLIFTSSSLSAS
jgi:hypothetical protein